MQPDCWVEVSTAGIYFKCKVMHLLSHSVSMGTMGAGGIIVLVCSVNVCQMDSAFAAVECAGKSPAQGEREKKGEAL